MADRLRPEEWEYIRNHCMSTSDEKMAKYLGRTVVTIIKARRKLGINKKVGGGVISPESRTAIDNGSVFTASETLTEDQRKKFYQTQFSNSLYYKNLKEQFTPEEIDFYLEEWGSLCVQFEDIVATEKRQIDEYIKMSILGSRLLRDMRVIEDEIKILQKEVEAFRRAHPNLDMDEDAQKRDEQLLEMVQTMYSQSKAIAMDHQKIVDTKVKLLGELNARRKDRVDQLSKRGTTFLSIIQELRDRHVRENQGRHMELVRLSKEKKKSEWRKPTTFPDGSQDCILLDDQSYIPKKEVVLLSQELPDAIKKFSKQQDAKILIVDDDSKRLQFFGDIFKGNQLEFASNVDKALDKLKSQQYDLVCLDYDLGLETKGSAVAEQIAANNLCQNAEIVIHSMNRDGAYQIKSILSDRKTETCPYIDMVKLFGEQNAKNSIGV